MYIRSHLLAVNPNTYNLNTREDIHYNLHYKTITRQRIEIKTRFDFFHSTDKCNTNNTHWVAPEDKKERTDHLSCWYSWICTAGNPIVNYISEYLVL